MVEHKRARRDVARVSDYKAFNDLQLQLHPRKTLSGGEQLIPCGFRGAGECSLGENDSSDSDGEPHIRCELLLASQINARRVSVVWRHAGSGSATNAI